MVYRYSGMHRDDGMLIMNGPGVRPGGEIEGAAIVDIAPTVLHTMELPIPSDMDGRVLTEVFMPDYIEAFPIRIGEPVVWAEMEGVSYTEEGEKEILERLRGLGYLG